MVLIYSETTPARLQYIARLLLEDLFGLETEFTNDFGHYLSFNGPKVNYSDMQSDQGLRIHPVSLLFEKSVFDIQVPVGKHQGMTLLYPDGNSDMPFDLFAASFYLVSRYEEYVSSGKDRYGRFLYKNSIAGIHGFCGEPVVNLWARMLIDRLKEKWPGLVLNQPPFRYVSTIDVDHAFAYKGRTAWRVLGGFLRSLRKGAFGEFRDRLRVLTGLSDDPFDTFDYIQTFHTKLGIEPHFFILFADYHGHDNNVTLSNMEFRKIIAGLADKCCVGIHPSLSSNRKPQKLETEIAGLSLATGRVITSSRQHFLKFSFPKTYRHLITNGITDDFSIGYATETGFRAGIASPFLFFDLYRNAVTNLVIHPVTFMDVTLKDYHRLTPAKSIETVKQLTNLVRSVNGEMVSLWHNESLCDAGAWKGWKRVFEETTAYAAGKQE